MAVFNERFQQAICLDEGVLRELLAMMGDDVSLLQDLIDTYIQDTPSLILQLRTGWASGDTDEVAQAAHPLKSSSASMGAMRLSALAAELEAHGKAGNLQGLEPYTERLESEFQMASAQLREFLASLLR